MIKYLIYKHFIYGRNLNSDNIEHLISDFSILKIFKVRHLYHLVDPSPWPLYTSVAVFNLVIGLVMYMHFFKHGLFFLITGIIILIYILSLWFLDIILEGTYEGHHTRKVQRGLYIGIILFILSEVMFFFSFFWAYFHSSLAPTIEIGCIWPPLGIYIFDPLGIPFLNTLILLLSGMLLTISHLYLLEGNSTKSYLSLIGVLILALTFTILQLKEYTVAEFSINDSIYGSIFYMLTGFHGLHVIIGTIFLFVCLIRLNFEHFTPSHHIGFLAASWYWHFVDVVWIFLYIFLYWWGSSINNIFSHIIQIIS